MINNHDYDIVGCQKYGNYLHPSEAYNIAFELFGEYSIHDFARYQFFSCRNSFYAFCTSLHIPLSEITYCQKHACKSFKYAADFSRFVPEADIEYCYNFLHENDKKIIDRLILNVL